ncbi:MAG: hypothetical protein J6V47_05975 [Bacteroidaceae bacterium]|nr:hypothetical protein [Bacteroidaceae bacterium]
MEKIVNKVFLCLFLLSSSSFLYAQSDETKQVVLEKLEGDGDIDIDIDIDRIGIPERDLDIYSILPTVFYNAADARFTVTSPYVTFETVTYYIVDESGSVQQQSEIALPKGCDVELWLPLLPVGSYKIVFDFGGSCFQGEFEIE